MKSHLLTGQYALLHCWAEFWCVWRCWKFNSKKTLRMSWLRVLSRHRNSTGFRGWVARCVGWVIKQCNLQKCDWWKMASGGNYHLYTLWWIRIIFSQGPRRGNIQDFVGGGNTFGGRLCGSPGGGWAPGRRRIFESFQKILKKLRKCNILAYFSKNLTNHALIFRWFGRQTQFVGNFHKIFENFQKFSWLNFETASFYQLFQKTSQSMR